tara:strand:+ start:194 stop:382 length:189 start_codon:yes stop_codon:yes gene_type:complete
MGITKVTKIKRRSGKTKRNALILFFLSAFFRLCFKGIPSVVSNSVVEIVTSQIKKARINLAF